jgi:hypothetical protein
VKKQLTTVHNGSNLSMRSNVNHTLPMGKKTETKHLGVRMRTTDLNELHKLADVLDVPAASLAREALERFMPTIRQRVEERKQAVGVPA